MTPEKQQPVNFAEKTKFELEAEKVEAQEQKAKAVATKLFNPTELMKSASTITEAEAPGLAKSGMASSPWMTPSLSANASLMRISRAWQPT